MAFVVIKNLISSDCAHSWRGAGQSRGSHGARLRGGLHLRALGAALFSGLQSRRFGDHGGCGHDDHRLAVPRPGYQRTHPLRQTRRSAATFFDAIRRTRCGQTIPGHRRRTHDDPRLRFVELVFRRDAAAHLEHLSCLPRRARRRATHRGCSRHLCRRARPRPRAPRGSARSSRATRGADPWPPRAPRR